MQWPLTAALGDAVIVQQDAPSGRRFVVYGGSGAQLACSSYTDAEARAASYAERARASVWYVNNGQLQLVCSFVDVQRIETTRSPREGDHD
jgi:hypothetical protein